jgi:predicted neuraminidase
LLASVIAPGVSGAVQVGLIIDAADYAAALLESDEKAKPTFERIHAARLWSQLAADLLKQSDEARSCDLLRDWVGALHTLRYPAIAGRAQSIATELVDPDDPGALECLRVARDHGFRRDRSVPRMAS